MLLIDSLEEYMVKTAPSRLKEDSLVLLWQELCSNLSLNPAGGEEHLLSVARDVSALLSDQFDPQFGGAWQWDLTDGFARALVMATLLSGVLNAAGVRELPTIVIPTVLPLLFDFKRLRLERRAENVVSIIGARKQAFERTGQRKELYETLPPEVKASLSFQEFSEFVDDAIDAGNAREVGEAVHILPNGETEFWLLIR